jgi:hypothetical protein
MSVKQNIVTCINLEIEQRKSVEDSIFMSSDENIAKQLFRRISPYAPDT